MAKAPKLEDRIKENLSNFIFIRLAKNMGVFKRYKPAIYMSILANLYDNEDYKTFKAYVDGEFFCTRLARNKEMLAEFTYLLICSEYIIHRLGYRNRLRDYIEMFKNDFRSTYGIYHDSPQIHGEYIKKYTLFKQSILVRELVKTIQKNGNEWWGIDALPKE